QHKQHDRADIRAGAGSPCAPGRHGGARQPGAGLRTGTLRIFQFSTLSSRRSVMTHRVLAISAASALTIGVTGAQGASVSEYFDYDGTDSANLNTFGSSGDG